MMTVRLEPQDSIVSSVEIKNHEATFILFSNIKNSSKLRDSLIKSELEATLLKPSMIYDILQVTVATNRAVRSKIYNRMTTRSVYAEIVYNMSPNKQITDALSKFGFSDKDHEALAVVLSSSESDKVSNLKNAIEGEEINLDSLKTYTNEKDIKKVYKLSENEINNSMLGSILSRMACKEFPVS